MQLKKISTNKCCLKWGGLQPAHIHIQREKMLAKFWLKPVALASSTRFPPKELRKLEQLVVENKDTFLEAWNGYFSS